MKVCTTAQTIATSTLPRLYSADEVIARIGKRIGGFSVARLLELADAGYCPCVRIDGGSPRFSVRAVSSWIRENMMQVQDGMPLPRVLHVARASVAGDIPFRCPISIEPLSQYLRLINEALLEAQPGVYFLIKDHTVVYVGQSRHVFARVAGHAAQHRKTFDCAVYLPIPSSELDPVEAAFIRLLAPPLNARRGSCAGTESLTEMLRKHGYEYQLKDTSG